MLRLISAAALLAIAGTSYATQALASDKYKNERDLAAAVMPSFVNIYNRAVVSEPKSDGPVATASASIQDDVGSGVIVDPSGIIVTNRHVIEGAYALFVTMADGKHYPAKLIGKALTYDLALIKVDAGYPLPVAKLGDSEKMRVGDRVVAVGNPLGFANSVSSGIISAFHRNIGLSAFDDLIQTDATINRGNSGGPLYNMNGEVIGINQAIYTQNKGGSIGIGFSIPVDDLKHLLESLKKTGKPHIGWIGVVAQTVTPAMADSLGIKDQKGTIISDVKEGSPAQKAGFQVGDVVQGISGDPVVTIVDLHRKVAKRVDQNVSFSILRGGKPMTISAAILPWPADLWSSKMPEAPDLKTPEQFGITLADKPGSGPVAKEVKERSVAWTAGIRPGDVIERIGNTSLSSIADFQREVDAIHASGKKRGIVLLNGSTGRRWVEVSLNE